MSNAKKILSTIDVKERSYARVKKLNVKLDNYHDAIVDGKLVVKEKGKLYFERNILGKITIHSGYVFSVKGDVVTIFDETREQFHAITLSTNTLKVKAQSEDDLILSEDLSDKTSVNKE